MIKAAQNGAALAIINVLKKESDGRKNTNDVQRTSGILSKRLILSQLAPHVPEDQSLRSCNLMRQYTGGFLLDNCVSRIVLGVERSAALLDFSGL